MTFYEQVIALRIHDIIVEYQNLDDKIGKRTTSALNTSGTLNDQERIIFAFYFL